jgi:hypothetical protein
LVERSAMLEADQAGRENGRLSRIAIPAPNVNSLLDGMRKLLFTTNDR